MALFVVATPIGNLEDMSLRAIRTLKEVALIACEDTRHTKILLDRYEISTPRESFHAYSDERKLGQLVARLEQGESIALVTDAGTPGISDPGYVLIKQALEKGIEVIPIPGPSAFLTALSASGFNIHEFTYVGFLPHKKGRQTFFKNLHTEERVMVFYESPYRLHRTLEDLKTYLAPDRKLCVMRELTKKFEEKVYGTVEEVYEKLINVKPRGEYVIVVEGSHQK